MFDFSKSIQTTLKSLSESLSQEFSQKSTAAGWSSQITNQLTVDASSGNVNVKIPDHLTDHVNNLEYGDGMGSAPSGVIRQFIGAQQGAINSAVALNVDQALMGGESGLF
jgi:hypothetical protein